MMTPKNSIELWPYYIETKPQSFERFKNNLCYRLPPSPVTSGSGDFNSSDTLLLAVAYFHFLKLESSPNFSGAPLEPLRHSCSLEFVEEFVEPQDVMILLQAFREISLQERKRLPISSRLAVCFPNVYPNVRLKFGEDKVKVQPGPIGQFKVVFF